MQTWRNRQTDRLARWQVRNIRTYTRLIESDTLLIVPILYSQATDKDETTNTVISKWFYQISIYNI